MDQERVYEDDVAVIRFARSLRGYDAEGVSIATGVDTGVDSLTQQSLAAEADVNVIVKRFGITGPPIPRAQGVYGDFTGITDFETAVERIEQAERNFMQLPPELRERFGNSTARFLDYASGKLPEDLVRELGLAPPVDAPPSAVNPPAVAAAGPGAGEPAVKKE